METLIERLIAWTLRTITTAVMFAGGALLVASMPSFVLSLGDSPLVGTIRSTLLQWAGVLLAAGIAAKYLLRPNGRRLPNEQVAITPEQRAEVGGWLLAMTAVLVIVPIVMVVQLQPYLAEWREVVVWIQSWDLSGDMGMSGIVLVPVAGVLIPPFFQLATIAAFIGTSAIVLVLLVSRSHRFPRVYLVCFALATGLMLASVRGMSTIAAIADGVREQIATTSINAEEAATMNAGVDRYMNAVGSAAPALWWAWLAYAVWLVPLFLSPRVRLTFASPVQKAIVTPETPQDVVAVTAPPRFPGFF